MYSWFPNLSQISSKNSFGKGVFQILAEIKMTPNENRLFGRHFVTVQIFYIFSRNMVVIIVYIYIWCKDNLKIPVEKCFSQGGFHGIPPYALTEVRGTLCS